MTKLYLCPHCHRLTFKPAAKFYFAGFAVGECYHCKWFGTVRINEAPPYLAYYVVVAGLILGLLIIKLFWGS